MIYFIVYCNFELCRDLYFIISERLEMISIEVLLQWTFLIYKMYLFTIILEKPIKFQYTYV